MSLENLTPALGSTHSKKRVGRGQGSGTGKTAAKGHKGQRARAGFSIKRGFEGGQQPLQRRLPKVGFNSRVVKPYAINVDKNREILELEEITIDSIKSIHKMTTKIKRVKLIGSEAKALVAKIKDDNVTVSGN
ncbi:MAG: 50S ribosomal protein L15 [Sulfurospirillaceae bacterium]|jgi:large subunit ribosomal protein L15|nr:50S ribosomal protein L15 [Sulfurospirillaceae bacterium]MCK9545973.1 50S ribosomal protein L15 [Sulfurospirillaceae bacterium]MDY0237399.1 50S ribosomal protein L15 [Campylobacterales bacterium]NLM98755.1 50S ribosomal protein L15 [Campylobacteraceae bacterium]